MRFHIPFILSLSVVGLATTGCLHFSSSARRVLPELPPTMEAEFSHVRATTFALRDSLIKTGVGYTLRRFELTPGATTIDTNRLLVLDAYLPAAGAGSWPTVLVLPILGGGYELERHVARYFSKRGLAAVIVHREKTNLGDAPLDAVNALLKQTLCDNQLAVDWMETRPEFDTHRLGIFGASMGGIKGAMLTPLEPRIRAAVLGLTGGDLPYILAYTTEPGISKRRAALLREQHVSPAAFAESLRPGLTCDPERFAPYVDSGKVLLVLAACDTVVPFPKGQLLRHQMGNPETVIVPAGHYTSLLFLPYIKRQSLAFLRRKLSEPIVERRPEMAVIRSTP